MTAGARPRRAFMTVYATCSGRRFPGTGLESPHVLEVGHLPARELRMGHQTRRSSRGRSTSSGFAVALLRAHRVRVICACRVRATASPVGLLGHPTATRWSWRSGDRPQPDRPIGGASGEQGTARGEHHPPHRAGVAGEGGAVAAASGAVNPPTTRRPCPGPGSTGSASDATCRCGR